MLPEHIRHQEELVWARRLTWLYFWLLIFEGALRKWITPGLSTPLLIVRDPIVVLIYMLMASRNAFPMNGFVGSALALAFATGLSAMLFGHQHFGVTLYGLRTNFLHIPLIFIIPRIFTLDDVWRIGKSWLWLALPMALLIAKQFSSPPTHILNVTVGGTFDQLWGAAGRVRPSATFSFITGTVSFLAVTAAFCTSAFFEKRYRLLRLFAFGALLISIACSISRAAMVSSLIVFAAAGVMMLLQPKKFTRGLGFIVAIAILGGIISATPVFKEGTEVFTQRLEETETHEVDATEGIKNRMFNDLLSPLETFQRASLFGYGTGAGTNVAASLMMGTRGFALAELEWSRILLEDGLVLGAFVIILRIGLCFHLVYWSFVALKQNNTLPWLLMSAVLPFVLNSQWGQPTAQGFAALGAGLVLAATRPGFAQSKLVAQAATLVKK